MKVVLLHGPGKISSRIKLISLKQKFDPNNVVIFEEGEELEKILGIISTPSLLEQEQLIILENPSEDFINYTLYPIPYVSEGKESSAYTLILWFDHEISAKKPILEWVRKNKGEILLFPEAKEVSVFLFLDYLAAGDKKAFLEMAKLKKKGFDIFYFLTMTFYLLRNLIATPKTAPQFVKQKLEKQRKRFGSDDLKKLYKEFLEIEFKIKKGLLEIPQAEFLLINKFRLSRHVP